MRLLLAVLVALACSLCQAQQTVEFADGQVEVVLPSEFRIIARPRQSLIATFGAKGDCEIKLVFISRASGPDDIGEQFIREMNQGKGKLVLQSSGKVAFMDPDEDVKQDEAFRTMRWQVGFGRSVVVIYLTAPSTQPMSPALKEFLGEPLNVLIASLRRKGA